MAILPQDIVAQIADVVDERIEVHLEQLRQGFHTNIQQLVSNQQALVEMIAQGANPEAMTALAHEAWSRFVYNEAARLDSQLADVLGTSDFTQPETQPVATIVPDPFQMDQSQEPEPAVKPRMVLCPNRVRHGDTLVHPPDCAMCNGLGKVPEDAHM